jgi:hypothetical protein
MLRSSSRPLRDRDVDAVLHEIREAIFEMEIDRDAGIAARELRQQWHEILAPEPDRRTHPQDPGWCASRVAENGGGCLKLFDRRAATFVIDRTFIGQRQSPRRAIEEPDAERGFEALHVLARGRRRYAEGGCRFGETARGNDLHEGGYAGRVFHEILNQRLTVIQPIGL